jgi:hypothetical protein
VRLSAILLCARGWLSLNKPARELEEKVLRLVGSLVAI